MPADLTKPFAESCCDGGACNDEKLSAQPCGCDPRENHLCEQHNPQERCPACASWLHTADECPKTEVLRDIFATAHKAIHDPETGFDAALEKKLFATVEDECKK